MLLCLFPGFVSSAVCQAKPSQKVEPSDPLRELSGSVQQLASRVSPAVVQILVTGYGPLEEGQVGQAGIVVGRQRAIGSGVIVDSNGYIMTNAHVVEGAQRVRVALSSAGGLSPLQSLTRFRGPMVNATLVGTYKPFDLALVKIEGVGLPTVPFGDYSRLRQGQLVFAFGSPGGLENSMTLGVVSAVARQPDPNSPIIYIQTDAPINPGNSGGPLVDVDGSLVGLNTFILTQSGGSEGLGFAIPSPVVRFVYLQLRKYGHVHRPVIGAGLQSITPTLAAGLQLQRDHGVIVSDVLSGGPAEAAGLKVGDTLLDLEGRPIESLPEFEARLFAKAGAGKVSLDVLRGSEKVSLEVAVEEEQHDIDQLAVLADPAENLIPKLGILGLNVNKRIGEMASHLRKQSGVIVAARTIGVGSSASGLVTGDVIHEINGETILTIDALRQALERLKPTNPVVLQIERDGRLMYLAFELE